MARQEGRIDPEVTDAVVIDQVGRQRWFWLLLLKRGIGVLTVATRDEAEALMADDPAVRAGRLRAEVRPWFTTPGDRLPD